MSPRLEEPASDTEPSTFEDRAAVLLRLAEPILARPGNIPAGNGWSTLFAAVQAMGLEGVVAKRLSGAYRPGERAWIKTKNRRYPLEVDVVRKRIERRALTPTL